MDERLIFIILIIAFIIIIISSLVLLGINLNKRHKNKMRSDIRALLEKIIKEDPENISLVEYVRGKKEPERPYDFLLTTKNYNYHIKCVPNYNNDEICVNNSVKWQVRKNHKDTHIRFVPNIDLLMRYDLDLRDKDTKKLNKKLYIIYPSAKSLLKYINECELEFVSYQTDVYGSRIVRYVDLLDHINLIEL